MLKFNLDDDRQGKEYLQTKAQIISTRPMAIYLDVENVPNMYCNYRKHDIYLVVWITLRCQHDCCGYFLLFYKRPESLHI